jgi:hypothetical protein
MILLPYSLCLTQASNLFILINVGWFSFASFNACGSKYSEEKFWDLMSYVFLEYSC